MDPLKQLLLHRKKNIYEVHREGYKMDHPKNRCLSIFRHFLGVGTLSQ